MAVRFEPMKIPSGPSALEFTSSQFACGPAENQINAFSLSFSYVFVPSLSW